MPGLAALSNAARTLPSCPLDRAARRRAKEGARPLPSRFGLPAQVTRRWRRKILKRLNPRLEMVWPRRPQTPEMWGAGRAVWRVT